MTDDELNLRSLIEVFVPVVRLYLDAFDDDESMTLPEKLMLQDVEQAMATWDAVR